MKLTQKEISVVAQSIYRDLSDKIQEKNKSHEEIIRNSKEYAQLRKIFKEYSDINEAWEKERKEYNKAIEKQIALAKKLLNTKHVYFTVNKNYTDENLIQTLSPLFPSTKITQATIENEIILANLKGTALQDIIDAVKEKFI